ncbi:hypothetical protein QUB37_17395 [Microcoleus sp. AT3-A2]
MTDSQIASPEILAPPHRRLALSLPAWLVLICIIAFTALLAAGAAIWKNAPPLPDVIHSPKQEIVITKAQIQETSCKSPQ